MREEARADWARSLSGRRVGVVLSSGFFGFYAHAGFLKANPSTPIGRCAGLRRAAAAVTCFARGYPRWAPGRMDRGAEAVEAGYRETLAIIEAGNFRPPAAPRG